MQFLSMELAWWFNVGVSMFLCISGFLYGQADTKDITQFYKKRFTKILVPYYLVIIPIGLLEIVYYRGSVDYKPLFGSLICYSQIKGGEHLWFVSCILFCYAITPILNSYRDKCVNSRKRWLLFLLLGCTVAIIYLVFFNKYFDAANVTCYIIGYLIGVNKRKGLGLEKIILILSFVFALVGNGFQIYNDYITGYKYMAKQSTIYKQIYGVNHEMFGILLFMTLYLLFKRCRFHNYSKRILDISDKYSYETYLVHQFLILGPFSLMARIQVFPLNIIVILIGIAIFSFALKMAENTIYRFIDKKSL